MFTAYQQAVLIYSDLVEKLGNAVDAATFSEYEFARRKRRLFAASSGERAKIFLNMLRTMAAGVDHKDSKVRRYPLS